MVGIVCLFIVYGILVRNKEESPVVDREPCLR